MFREAVLAFMGVGEGPSTGSGAKAPRRRDQAPGERCRGAHLEECRRYFKQEEVLNRVCGTCPD